MNRPGLARYSASPVGVRSKPLNVDPRSAAPGLEVLLELPRDHVWRVRSGKVRPEDSRHIRRLRESVEQRGEPALVRRRRVLRQEGDVVASGQLHDQVAGSTVRVLALRESRPRAHRSALRSRPNRRWIRSRPRGSRPRGRARCARIAASTSSRYAAPLSTGIATVTMPLAHSSRSLTACEPSHRAQPVQ